MTIEAPIKTVSEANAREHWRARQQRAKNQRLAVSCALSGKKLPPLPCIITITRIGKRMLDSDNLAISQKHVRDQIADEYGVDDGSNQYEWRYSQRIGKAYGVEISIVPV